MILRIIAVVFLIVSLSNCVAVQTFPKAARAGDTITVAVGSTDGLNQSNLSVQFYPDSDPLNPVDITTNVRSIIRLYPDKTSKAYWDTTSGNGLENMTYLSTLSLHGPWETVVALDLPVTLPVGTGVIKVQFGPEVSSPLTLATADNVDIALEVLPAAGSSHLFEYRKLLFNTQTNIGDLQLLEQNRQVVVRMPITSANVNNAQNIAAAEYTLTVPVIDATSTDVTNQLANSDFSVILDDQPSYVKNQVNLVWSRTGSQFKVIITSPTGQQNAKQLRFSILLSNLSLSQANGWQLSSNATLDLVKYFDQSGIEITAAPPALIVQN